MNIHNNNKKKECANTIHLCPRFKSQIVVSLLILIRHCPLLRLYNNIIYLSVNKIALFYSTVMFLYQKRYNVLTLYSRHMIIKAVQYIVSLVITKIQNY